MEVPGQGCAWARWGSASGPSKLIKTEEEVVRTSDSEPVGQKYRKPPGTDVSSPRRGGGNLQSVTGRSAAQVIAWPCHWPMR